MRDSDTARPRLAIISSWNENCGNASYTYALKKEFERHYDVEVLGLDLFLLQRSGLRMRALARRHIRQIAERLHEFDYVNIQFEAGLYGATLNDMLVNVKILLDAAPNVILTLHRVDVEGNSLGKDLVSSLLGLSLQPLRRRRAVASTVRMYRRIIGHCRRLTKRKNVWIMVHTRRDRRNIKEFYDFPNVVDAPLGFLNVETRQRVMGDVRPDDLRRRYSLPPGARTIGAFGYIADYKGFEDLIKAITILPPEWHLLVVGSQHPQSIRPWQPISPYLRKLLHGIEGGALESLDWIPDVLRRNLRVETSLERRREAVRDPARLLDRIRFIGNVDDDEFTFMLRNVDAVVLPYLEVGQSMSGVVVLALESGARLFCSNNLSFAEVRRYYGDTFSRFDMGNYVEIAQKVQFDTSDYSAQREKMFARHNVTEVVNAHRALFEKASARVERG